jgi:hypothetical protein
LLRSLQEIQPDFEEAKAYAGLWSQEKKKKKKKKANSCLIFLRRVPGLTPGPATDYPGVS